MKFRNAGHEVHCQPAASEYVATNKNVVWRVKGGETCDISLNIEEWQRESDAEIRDLNRRQSRLMKFTPRDRLKFQMKSERLADAGAGGAGVNLGEDT